jgi:hypothetical protein
MKTFLCSHLVTLRWNAGETVANLEKISAAVASVNAEQKFEKGLQVTIATGSCDLAGKVSQCWPSGYGYEIYIALDRRWSREVFVPDHLYPDR